MKLTELQAAIVLGVLAVVLGILAMPRERTGPAGSSSLSELQALGAASVVAGHCAPGTMVTYAQATGSMLPMIDERSVLVIEPVEGRIGAVRLGDVVMVKTSSGVMMHRVVQVHAGGIVTKGDNNASLDELVPWAKVQGRLVAIIFQSR